MMILCSLKLENFKKYKTKTIEFGQGLIGIIGKNGSGKSTIFEAILFALYGELKQRGWKETIRNASATTKDVVSCELVFEFEEKEYKIVREFRGKALIANAKLFKNGELQASGAKDVTNYIISLTKMSKDAFIHTLFASQKELTSLSSLKNEDRKKMIRKLLGLEKIDFIEGVLVEKSRELKRAITVFAEVLLSEDEVKIKQNQKEKNEAQKEIFEKDIVLKTSELDEVKKQELEIKKELQKLQSIKESRQKLLSSLELIKNSINSNKAHQTKLGDELKVLELKKSELKTLEVVKKEYISLIESLKEQEKLKEYHLTKEGLVKEQVQLREQYTKYKDDIARLEKESISHDKLIEELKKIDNILIVLKQDIVKEQAIKTDLQKEIGGEQKLIDDTNKKISKITKLGANSNCPTCTRPLLDEYTNVINSLNNIVKESQTLKINTLTSKIEESEKKIKDIELKKEVEDKKQQKTSQNINLILSKKKDLALVLEHFKKVSRQGQINKQEITKLEQYSYDQTKHFHMIKTQIELKSKYEYVLSLETMLKRFDTISLELKNITTKLNEQDKEFALVDEKYKAINYDELPHKHQQELHDKTTKKKDEQVKLINEINIKVASITGEIKTIQSLLQNHEKQLTKLQTKKDDLLDYEKIKVSLGEFKTKINSKVAPRISAIASQMYSTITKGKYQHIEVSNDFDFFIYDDGKKYPIERFSGGEIDLANLVLRIAISKTLAELNGASSIGFLAFDEVFGSQDEGRRMEILEAFHTIKEQYRQIFLISHEMEIKEMFEIVVEL